MLALSKPSFRIKNYGSLIVSHAPKLKIENAMATLRHREGDSRIYELADGAFEVRRGGVLVKVCSSLAGAKMLIRLVKQREATAAMPAQKPPGVGGPG